MHPINTLYFIGVLETPKVVYKERVSTEHKWHPVEIGSRSKSIVRGTVPPTTSPERYPEDAS